MGSVNFSPSATLPKTNAGSGKVRHSNGMQGHVPPTVAMPRTGRDVSGVKLSST